MDRQRRLALTAGLLYLLTVVTSVPALALKKAALSGTAGPSAMALAALLEVVLAVACVGTALALFGVLKEISEARALGFIASRTVEAAIIAIGVVAMLTATTTGDRAFVAAHDWAFLLGPGLIPAINAALLAPLLLRGGLVPAVIPRLGLAGAALLAVSATASLFGVVDQVSATAALAALPIAAWEISLGLWLTVRGFSVPTPAMQAA